MKIYSIVQATGNSQSGGVRLGLLIRAKDSMPVLVRSADNPPTASGMVRQSISFFHCIFKKSLHQ